MIQKINVFIHQYFLFCVVALIVLGWISLPYIPWAPFWGYDFHNIHVYQTCAKYADNPYLADAVRECGDHAARPVPYPPLLYFLMTWCRALPLFSAAVLWNVLTVIMTVGSLWLWRWMEIRGGAVAKGPSSGRTTDFIFALALLTQFPFVFAMERGNNDVLVVAVWTLVALSAQLGWAVPFGFLAGTAVVLKVYPALAFTVLSFAVLVSGLWLKFERRAGLIAAFSAAAAMWLFGYALWPEVAHSYRVLVQSFATQGTGIWHYTHSISRTFAGKYWVPALVARMGLLTISSVAGAAAWRRDRIGVLAQALAMSTFFAGVSYDYNLITAYPLLCLLYWRQKRWLTLIGLFCICSGRIFFLHFPFGIVPNALQFIWLAAAAIALNRNILNLNGFDWLLHSRKQARHFT